MIGRGLTFLQPTATYRELILLEEIGRNPNVTQTDLAKKAGIVPAMVNNYIKNFTRDGIVNVDGNKTRNVRYILTPDGERRKFDLLMSYVKETVTLYKNAKEGLKTKLNDLVEESIKTVVLYGAADTAELAFSAADEVGLDIVAVVDSNLKKQGTEFLGMIIESPDIIEELSPDAVLISSFGYQDQIYDDIKYLEEIGIKVRKLQ